MTGTQTIDAIDGDNLDSVKRRQALTEGAACRIAALLDLSECSWPDGTPVPFGWHFALFGAETSRALLRADGFPGLGVPFPEVTGNRLVAAGRKVETWRELQIGQEIQRTSRIASISLKATAQGPLTIVKVEHVILDLRDAATILTEEQTYMVLDTPYAAPSPNPASPSDFAVVKTVTPNDTMLFQFSALSFNSHKIHLDRDYARTVEGYPDLVVNGGLTTLLMTEIARAEYGNGIRSLTVRNSAPLFANRPIQFAWGTRDGQRSILAYDDTGCLAAEMEFETDDL